MLVAGRTFPTSNASVLIDVMLPTPDAMSRAFSERIAVIVTG
jgi:hypothetical protein